MQRLQSAFIVLALFLTHSAFAQVGSATLSKIKKSGEITLGYREDSVPFSFLDAEKKPAGYSINLCLRIANEIKTQLVLSDLKIKYAPVTPQNRFDKLNDNTIDIECGSTTNTLTRQKLVAFTYTTYMTGTALAGRTTFKGKEIEDLVGKKIGVAKGTTNERVIRRVVADKSLKVEIRAYDKPAEVFNAMEKGEVDAAGTDDVLLYGSIAKSKTPENFVVFGRQLSVEPYGLAVRKDDYEFFRTVNAALAKLFASGEINTIFNNSFKSFGIPMNDPTKSAFRLQAIPE